MHACIHTYIHAYMHTCIHAYMHTYIHTYIYIYISGVKNHLSWSPGQVKFQAGHAYIFTQCPAGK